METAYSLSCGCVERKRTAPYLDTSGNVVSDRHVEMWKEHGVYHVRATRFNYRDLPQTRLYWRSFPRLADARSAFRKVCRLSDNAVISANEEK